MDWAEPTELPGGFASQNSCACTRDHSEEWNGRKSSTRGEKKMRYQHEQSWLQGKKNEEYKKKIPKTALQQLKSKVEWNTRVAKEVVKVLRSIRNTQLLSDSTFESWVLKASKAAHPPEHPHRLCFYGVHKVFSRLWWDFSSILFILQVCLINKWTL